MKINYNKQFYLRGGPEGGRQKLIVPIESKNKRNTMADNEDINDDNDDEDDNYENKHNEVNESNY